ncbi:ABC transporter permease [Paenibacillus caui]|uniref:ABC transporter permease n=1 Tax=Paenibacillus caui TaxID=2873927 RepID=UPI001CA7D94C|nr:ABC transporter permease [Paenibacillus caui]
MNKLGTVVRFSLLSKVKKKSFMITMIIIAIIVSILVNVPYLIQVFTGKDDESKSVRIGLLYDTQPQIAETFKQASQQLPNAGYTLIDYKQKTDSGVLQQDIDQDKIDGYLQFGEEQKGGFPDVTYISKSGSDLEGSLQATIQSALQNVKMRIIAGGSLSNEQLGEMGVPVQLNEQKAGSADSGSKKDNSIESNLANYIYVYVLIILFLMINTMTGSMIASEVTSEKSSRIMEILITSVSPLTQMFGKIIAMFLLGLMQIAFLTLIVVGNVAMPHNRQAITEMGVDLSQISLDVFLFGLLLYVLGYFLYATLFAAIGSLVSRTEELGQAIMPITLLLMISFYVGMFSMGTPNAILIKITSFIPFTSPISMLVRIGIGDVAAWEIAVSLAILLVSIVFFGWLSAKIYRTGVLMYGKRPSLRELGKAMRAYKM